MNSKKSLLQKMELERTLRTENLWKVLFCLVIYTTDKMFEIVWIYPVKDTG